MENETTEPAFEHVPPPHPISAEIDKLTETIKAMNPGDVMTYGDVAAIIQQTPKTEKFRSIVQRSIHKLTYEFGVVASVVRGIGIKRETSEGITRNSVKAIPAVRRKVLRERRKLKCVEIGELTQEVQTQYILTSSLLGVLLTISAPRFIGKLEVKCIDAANAIPSRSVMQLFLKTDKNNVASTSSTREEL
jgi:hypothetical protein